jgi:hypothetical protein
MPTGLSIFVAKRSVSIARPVLLGRSITIVVTSLSEGAY